MSMRSLPDRIRHAVLFEAVGLVMLVPLGAWLFGLEPHKVGVVGVAAATIATLWNFVFNLGFDHAMRHAVGHTRKSIMTRILHAGLFELGLLIMLLPPIAWYLGMTLWATLLMDLSMIGFYLAYAFGFNIAYDRVFPIPARAAVVRA
ncbi:MAG: PACE efflux transporter [Pseudomonadota bacterium]